MMRIHKLTLAGLTVIGVLAVSAVPAGALTGYTNLCPSLQTAICGGEFTYETRGVAVDNSSGPSAGDVWVSAGDEVEFTSGTLVKYDSSGNEILALGSEVIPPGVRTVAVDPTSGDVYVSALDGGGSTSAIIKFNSSGVVQFQLTEGPQGPWRIPAIGAIAVGPDGDLYVVEETHGVIDKFTSSGAFIEDFPMTSVGAIVVGPEGNLYVLASGQVREYSATGAPVSGSCVLNVPAAGVMTMDPSDGHLFLVESSAAEREFVSEYSSLCATAPTVRMGGGGELPPTSETQLSVSGSTHDVYVSGRRPISVFGQITIPEVTTGATPTDVTRTSARVNGTVQPDETEVTSCEFEYGVTPALGLSVPCEQTLPLEGNKPVAVSAEISGVNAPPGTQVYYRLRVNSSDGARNAGEGESFYLESFPPPVIGGVAASSVSQFSATLNATLETGEALVSYHFEYGTTTAYGSIAPIPDDYTPLTNETVPLSQPVSGLQAGTTYHYRLVASSPGGTNVAGPDETFTTLPVPAPEAQTGPSSEVGVGSATVAGTVDPHGENTTYLFEYGTSAAYGSSWPTVLADMGALEGPQPVIVTIPNLLPKTTYHYRLIANNGGGSSYGQDMTFTTGEYPAQVIQEPPSLGTLLVPTLGETAKAPAKKTKKAKKSKKHAKSKHKARRKKKR
jgi:hypothetical protein